MEHLKLIAAAVATGALAMAAQPVEAEYPERPATIICLFAIGFEEAMGQPINVVNRTGGSGVVGHDAFATAQPDGYTLGACTWEITYFKTIGLADITPDRFALISRLEVLSAGVTVAANIPYAASPDLVDTIKAGDANAITSSGSGLSGPWHMALAGLLKAAGEPAARVDFVLSQGGTRAFQDLAAGDLTLFTGSPIEVRVQAHIGEVRILAIMSGDRSPAFPDVSARKDEGIDFALTNWFSVCGSRGSPATVEACIAAAAEQTHGPVTVQDALAQRGITPLFDGPEAFATFAAGFTDEAQGMLGGSGLA